MYSARKQYQPGAVFDTADELTVAGLSEPDRGTAEPTASPPVEHEVGACVGPQRKNETLPVGFGAVPTSAVPVMTALSVTDVPGPTLAPETEF